MTEPGDTASPTRSAFAPVAWYCVIACFNAAFYVALGELFTALKFSPSAAGVLALIPVLVVSYLGHKSKTFRSRGSHRREAPRFIALSIMDLALAAAVPYLVHRLGGTPLIAFMILTMLVPLANFAVMRFWIFRS